MIEMLLIIALLWIAAGTLLILYTEWTKNVFKSILYFRYIRWYSMVPFTVGVFLLFAALHHQEVFWLAIIVGLLAIAKGVYILLGSPANIEGLIKWWYEEASDRTARLFGLITFLIGVALFSRLV